MGIPAASRRIAMPDSWNSMLARILVEILFKREKRR
jgi:hypothetical protein